MTRQEPPTRRRSRQRWILPGLALLFMGPLLVAWLLYFFSDGWRPGGTVNHGRLLQPPVVLLDEDTGKQASVLQGKWSLVVLGEGRCESQCLDVLDRARRVRLALRNKAPRVQRIALYSETTEESAALDTLLPGLIVWPIEAEGTQVLVARLSGAAAPEPWSVFVVDPLGNAMMVYGPGFEMRGMLADLKRLLKLSRIG